jgi:hypothetical protein
MQPEFNADPGPIYLPGMDRYVFWTGKVAIGIRHRPQRDMEQPVPESELWIQELLLEAKEQ